MKPAQNTRALLIRNGVRNLREFGYPSVNEGNILTDAVYSAFFRKMLEESRDGLADTAIKGVINGLLAELPQEPKP